MPDSADEALTDLRNRLLRNGGLTLDVKVIPKASSTGFAGLMSDGCVKIKVTAAPERGKANEEVCRLLSRWFEVPVRSVSIISGASSARKRVHVEAER